MNAELLTLLSKNNIEAVLSDNNKIILYCPKLPPEAIKQSISKNLQAPHMYVEGMKLKTKRALRAILSQAGAINGKIIISHKTISIEAPETVNDIDWDLLCQILIEDGFPQSWSMTTSNGITHNYIVSPSENSKRDKPITDQDIQDLVIDLNSCNNIDEFIKRM
jgi:hypothetical protein